MYMVKTIWFGIQREYNTYTNEKKKNEGNQTMIPRANLSLTQAPSSPLSPTNPSASTLPKSSSINSHSNAPKNSPILSFTPLLGSTLVPLLNPQANATCAGEAQPRSRAILAKTEVSSNSCEAEL
jgi:hypothetical protein